MLSNSNSLSGRDPSFEVFSRVPEVSSRIIERALEDECSPEMGTFPQTALQVQRAILDIVDCALEEVGPCLSAGSGVKKENLAFSEALDQKLELVKDPLVRNILEGIITSIRYAFGVAKN